MKKNPNNKKMKQARTKGRMQYGIYFLVSVIFLYLILYLFKAEEIKASLQASVNLLVKIIPALVLVILFMGIINSIVNPKAISKYVGRGSRFRGWLLSIILGIVSHGPIYVWYPLLRELRDKGMRSGLIAVFLFNRAIKIPLIPLMVHYFGVKFVIVLLLYMILASVIQGKVIDMLRV